MERVVGKNPIVMFMGKALTVSFIISVACLVIISMLLSVVGMPLNYLAVTVVLTYILSNFVGGFRMGRGMGQKKYLWGLLLGLIYFIIIAIISMCVHSKEGIDMVSAGRTLMICMLSGMVGGMLS